MPDLPGMDVKVAPGDRVVAGETVLDPTEQRDDNTARRLSEAYGYPPDGPATREPNIGFRSDVS